MKRLLRWLRIIDCWVWGHQDVYLVQEFGKHQRRIACAHCGGDWAQNDHVYGFSGTVTLPWNRDFEDLYGNVFGHKIIKPWR